MALQENLTTYGAPSGGACHGKGIARRHPDPVLFFTGSPRHYVACNNITQPLELDWCAKIHQKMGVERE
ncbi:MAG: hypothetical protein LBR60_06280 [Fibrobacter sp.]|nr:hypothetical protein [Fibrobacter sp.]